MLRYVIVSKKVNKEVTHRVTHNTYIHTTEAGGGRNGMKELQGRGFLRKNLNASKPSEHPPSGEKLSKYLGGDIGCRDKSS